MEPKSPADNGLGGLDTLQVIEKSPMQEYNEAREFQLSFPSHQSYKNLADANAQSTVRS